MRSLLDPSAQVSPEWQGWHIRLRSGGTVYGRQIDVGGDEVELYTMGDGFVKFGMDDVEHFGLAAESLMPKGLEQQLTVADVQDLIAFLEQTGTESSETARVD